MNTPILTKLEGAERWRNFLLGIGNAALQAARHGTVDQILAAAEKILEDCGCVGGPGKRAQALYRWERQQSLGSPEFFLSTPEPEKEDEPSNEARHGNTGSPPAEGLRL